MYLTITFFKDLNYNFWINIIIATHVLLDILIILKRKME